MTVAGDELTSLKEELLFGLNRVERVERVR